MIIVAENISKHFGEAMDMLDGLQESINVSHSSIQEIADSTESTAEAIQKQAVMCSDIQGIPIRQSRHQRNDRGIT